MKKVILSTLSLVFFSTVISSCSDDERVITSTENHRLTIENTVELKDFVQSGTFEGTGAVPVVFPGESISFKFHAGKGQYLMFATMYGASKDWFFAPKNPGLKLYDDAGGLLQVMYQHK